MTITYRRKNAKWDTTTNPEIAHSWLESGEVVELTMRGSIIATWTPESL